ncbi:hypothetical protein NC796_12425 [Aliifodinibius sp. S!AR15-10]|uniref:hypothetical protein n=1 Tax=Aliifodinibius sp. S!AR15-10 TaxID=2950437 RepID=UPI002866FC49|nr:hypothetical protein [Aliifodinibius sp. S!AR15-10]MDR8391955.1 hypothetical protein [Aliifodinibius sp. S!AR15-10]
MIDALQKGLVLLVITSIGIGCSEQKKTTNNILRQEINTFEELKFNFQDPPSHYRSAPFWVWNDRVTEEKIDRQLRQFKEQGIGGVFIHPRMGLITPYLSGRWQELFNYAVEQGKQLDMKVYLYDENSFPSGFAGGHVPVEMPESVNKGHGLALERAEELPENVSGDYHLILKKEGEEFVDITDRVETESGEEGSYYLYKKVFYEKNDPWHGGFSYVDLIMPGVTEKFLDITTSGYQQNFGGEFGQNVPAIFSDEANVEYPDVENSIRWTPDLFEQFQTALGL